jgi:hypothetical protein
VIVFESHTSCNESVLAVASATSHDDMPSSSSSEMSTTPSRGNGTTDIGSVRARGHSKDGGTRRNVPRTPLFIHDDKKLKQLGE